MSRAVAVITVLGIPLLVAFAVVTSAVPFVSCWRSGGHVETRTVYGGVFGMFGTETTECIRP